MDDLAWADATELAALLKSRQVTSGELIEAAISRVEQLNPTLNAIIHPSFEPAQKEAANAQQNSPFAGVPFVVKDLFCEARGEPHHMGVRALRESAWNASEDSGLTRRFRSAGLISVGRTNTPEFAAIPTTEPAAFGPTRNPWNLERSPGGSSGGSAAAVAAGLVPVGHANDWGGSIRIPASACGLVGLKPSRGRVSPGPERAETAFGFGTDHVLTRSVRDSAAILDCIAGALPGDAHSLPSPTEPFADVVGRDPGRLRIGVRTAAPGAVSKTHGDCVTAARAAGTLLENLGHSVEENASGGLDAPGLFENVPKIFAVCTAMLFAEVAHMLGRELVPGDVEDDTWVMNEFGKSIGSVGFGQARESLFAWSRQAIDWCDRFDLLLTPMVAAPPPNLGTIVAIPQEAAVHEALLSQVAFSTAFNVTGQPALSLPLGMSAEGLPLGVQLVAADGREDMLFMVAAQLEQAAPWNGRRPRVCTA